MSGMPRRFPRGTLRPNSCINLRRRRKRTAQQAAAAAAVTATEEARRRRKRLAGGSQPTTITIHPTKEQSTLRPASGVRKAGIVAWFVGGWTSVVGAG